MAGLCPGHPSRHLCWWGWPGQAHGCPVRFWWTRCMTLIQLVLERLAAFETRAWSNVMRHQNSVFHAVLKHVPWDEFDRLVAEHCADARVRRLTTKSQFVAMLYGQLAG